MATAAAKVVLLLLFHATTLGLSADATISSSSSSPPQQLNNVGEKSSSNFQLKTNEEATRHNQNYNLPGDKKKGPSIVRRSASFNDPLEPVDLLMANHVDLIEANIRWKWCLLSISGNATIVRLRRNDFVKYLKMNVASLIGSDYDLVRVTAISYTPNVLVNASLHWTKETEPRIVKALGGLALHNDTLLDLSGEHFNLTDFFPASSLLSTKIVSPLEEGDAAAAAADPSRQMEAVVYLVIGLTVAFLLTASLIFAVCQCVSNRSKPSSSASTNGEAAKMTNSASLASEDAFRRRSYLQQSPMTEETISLDDFTPTSDRRPSQPQLIYTQEFNDGLGPLESYQYLLQKRPRNNGHHHGHQARPLSSPMSEIGFRQHHRPRPRPRPSSVLDEPYLLSPPPDFNCGYTSDVTSDLPRHWGHPRRPETPLVLSSFRRPTPEEIQRDVDIVFHNLGLSGIEAARQ